MHFIMPGMNEVQMKFSQLFGSWATKGKLERENKYGVQCKILKADPHVMLFVFVTPDEITVKVDVDTRKLSEEYIEDVVLRTKANIEKFRMQRKKEHPIEIFTKMPEGLH